MKDYSAMSDREIDKHVLNAIYGKQSNDKDILSAWRRDGFRYTLTPQMHGLLLMKTTSLL